MNTFTMPNLGRAAAFYANRGLRVIPCRPRDKIPATIHGTQDATTSIETITTWWSEQPDRNVAIATGSGIFVLDVDGDAGRQSLQQLEQENEPLPLTAECTTGRGRHLYFRHPIGVTIRNSASRVAAGLDVRGEGGCAVAPPSIHPSGQRYEWRSDRRIEKVSIAAAPQWLLSLISREHERAQPSNVVNEERATAYVRKAVAAEAAAVATALPGQRNDQLNRSSFALGQLVASGGVTRGMVESVLTGSALASGLTVQEIQQTLRSGIEAGLREPRETPEPRSRISDVRTEIAPVVPTVAWPELDSAAFHGFVGEMIETIEPHTEADPVALIGQFLAAFGSAIGRSPHFMAESSRHGCNLFAVLVADSSKGRKGTSWDHVRRLVAGADPTWEARLVSGLSSGEGLIHAVRDPVERIKPSKPSIASAVQEIETVDPGVDDKRLCVIEGEFASVLKVSMRDGNTLSPVIRNSWDGWRLSTLTRNSPIGATDPHIAIIGHITREELTRYLTDTEAGNGFGNRFLWLAIRRSKLLPEGGTPDVAQVLALSLQLQDILATARTLGELRRDEEARQIWHAVYPQLSAGKPGLLGAMTARAEAQTMRLALLYALLDKSPAIRREHLEAALALWSYSEQSAQAIFGDRLGDPIGDTILQALRGTPSGLSTSELHNVFGRHMSAGKISQRLGDLQARKLIASEARQTGGRDAVIWRVVH